jgi:signal transduction histidine kinase
MAKRNTFQLSLTVITFLMVVVIAGLAGGSLWILRRMHRQMAHATATRAVLDLGRLMTAHLADHPAVRGAGDAEDAWREFTRHVRSLYAVETGLQYVSVVRDGVIVFYQQRTALSEGVEPTDISVADPTGSDSVRVNRKLLSVGAETLPVVVFAARVADADGTPCLVEVAFRKDTVAREEESAEAAIASMFQVSLLTVLISFSVCAVLVVWMMRREHVRESLRRQEEHLAFAGVMANGIVHDFRNPMSSLKLDVQMMSKALREGAAGEDRMRRLAERIRGTVNRMDKVFEEFLYMSKPARDEREAVDVTRLVRECVDVLHPKLEAAQVAVDADLPDRGAVVIAYPSPLSRALLNILTNAVQFAPPRTRVTVRVARSGKRVTIDVSDRGPGVPSGEHERIFDMFYSTRPGGTGLGLFLARTAIERSGGTVSVLSGDSGGARFCVSLEAAEEGGEPASQRPQGAEDRREARSERQA